jgi:hypothetical protein
MNLFPGQLAFTICQTPVVYALSKTENITVYYSDGKKKEIEGKMLNEEISSSIFKRTGVVVKVVASIN